MIKFNSKAGDFYAGIPTSGHIPAKNWYLTKYGRIPNRFNSDENIKTDSFMKEYEKFIVVKDTNKDGLVTALYDIVAYMIDNSFSEDLQINKGNIILYYIKETKEFLKLKQYIIDNIVNEQEQGIINLVCQNNTGFYLQEFAIKNNPIDFSANYNEDFKTIDVIILNRLNTEEDKGLVLLYGEPGTGKTSYIRRIINKVNNKRILYMPPDMATQLSNPTLVPFLIKYPNSILIIEDAENVLLKRQGQHNQAISNILNMSDGLFGDCLNIQIVATFNTDLRNIDEALLRKGRLIAKYKFGPLTEDRAKKLSSTLGIKYKKNFKILADIYNSDEMAFADDKTRIGFTLKDDLELVETVNK